jgi:hypothetical protein
MVSSAMVPEILSERLQRDRLERTLRHLDIDVVGEHLHQVLMACDKKVPLVGGCPIRKHDSVLRPEPGRPVGSEHLVEAVSPRAGRVQRMTGLRLVVGVAEQYLAAALEGRNGDAGGGGSSRHEYQPAAPLVHQQQFARSGITPRSSSTTRGSTGRDHRVILDAPRSRSTSHEQSTLSRGDPLGRVRPSRVASRLLEYALPGDDWVRRVAVTADGTLDRLRVLAGALVNAYAWIPAQATIFVLCGVTPSLALCG